MIKKLLAEVFGTALLVFVILASGQPLAIGLALATGILIVGNISGGHFNPAVSAIMAYSGKLPMASLAPYVIAQVLGGLLAFELHKRL